LVPVGDALRAALIAPGIHAQHGARGAAEPPVLSPAKRALSLAQTQMKRKAGDRFAARTIGLAAAVVPISVGELVADDAQTGRVPEKERCGAVRMRIGRRSRALSGRLDLRSTPTAKEIVCAA